MGRIQEPENWRNLQLFLGRTEQRTKEMNTGGSYSKACQNCAELVRGLLTHLLAQKTS